MAKYKKRLLITVQAIYTILENRITAPAVDANVPEWQKAATKPGFHEDELMTIRQAAIELRVSRGTVDKLRKEGKLTSLHQDRNVRLIRAEVIAAKIWYSRNKGKL